MASSGIIALAAALAIAISTREGNGSHRTSA